MWGKVGDVLPAVLGFLLERIADAREVGPTDLEGC